MSDLFDIYFTEPNCIMPLLHRPTFLRAVADGLHLRDSSFGAVVLLVCAIASRYSNDPRVFIEDENCTRTSGWKWFEQVRVLKKNLLLPPTLYDVQYCCVSPFHLLDNAVASRYTLLLSSSRSYFCMVLHPPNQLGR